MLWWFLYLQSCFDGKSRYVTFSEFLLVSLFEKVAKEAIAQMLLKQGIHLI